MKKLDIGNIIIIGDTHLPAVKRGYLDFCVDTQKEYKCGTIVHIGDIVDNHSITYHEHDPDLWSPAGEMKRADRLLKGWFKAFPKLLLCRGNHDAMVDRKGRTVGLPKRVFLPFRDIWNLPKTWVDGFEFTLHGILFKHSGFGGKNAHLRTAIAARQSVVMGHLHSLLGVEWSVSTKDKVFGMSVGCGIDWKHKAFLYGKDSINKPVVGCGVILDRGKLPFVIPMKL